MHVTVHHPPQIIGHQRQVTHIVLVIIVPAKYVQIQIAIVLRHKK